MSVTEAGSIAAAQAYLAVGNFKLAKAHLAPILAADPSDSEACSAWCDLLVGPKKFAELETFARAWIGRDVHNPSAHLYLFLGFAGRSDRPNATAILEEFRELFPSRVSDFGMMRDLLETTCPNRASSFDGMIGQFQAAGDEKSALFLQCKAAFVRRDFAEAIRLGDLSWAAGSDHSWGAGYTATSIANFMAMLCFRSFRFAKSRHYAHLALRAEPGHAVGAELLVLTRLVWFPPFLMTHVALYFLSAINRERKVCSAVAGLILGLAILCATMSASIPADRIAWLALAIMPAVFYIGYFPFIGKVAAFAQRRRARNMQLSNY